MNVSIMHYLRVHSQPCSHIGPCKLSAVTFSIHCLFRVIQFNHHLEQITGNLETDNTIGLNRTAPNSWDWDERESRDRREQWHLLSLFSFTVHINATKSGNF